MGTFGKIFFLNSILDETDSKFIMTAHHGNDQAETLLMNLCRKTGVAGLKGIAKTRNRVIRPMLNLTKKEIVDFQNRNNFFLLKILPILILQYHEIILGTKSTKTMGK